MNSYSPCLHYELNNGLVLYLALVLKMNTILLSYVTLQVQVGFSTVVTKNIYKHTMTKNINVDSSLFHIGDERYSNLPASSSSSSFWRP